MLYRHIFLVHISYCALGYKTRLFLYSTYIPVYTTVCPRVWMPPIGWVWWVLTAQVRNNSSPFHERPLSLSRAQHHMKQLKYFAHQCLHYHQNKQTHSSDRGIDHHHHHPYNHHHQHRQNHFHHRQRHHHRHQHDQGGAVRNVSKVLFDKLLSPP